MFANCSSAWWAAISISASAVADDVAGGHDDAHAFVRQQARCGTSSRQAVSHTRTTTAFRTVAGIARPRSPRGSRGCALRRRHYFVRVYGRTGCRRSEAPGQMFAPIRARYLTIYVLPTESPRDRRIPRDRQWITKTGRRSGDRDGRAAGGRRGLTSVRRTHPGPGDRPGRSERAGDVVTCARRSSPYTVRGAARHVR